MIHRNNLKRIIELIFCLVGLVTVSASPVSEQVSKDQLSAIIVKQLAFSQSLTSLEFSMTRSPGNTSPAYKTIVHWWESGVDYKFQFKQITTDHLNDRETLRAFNGDTTQTIIGSQQVLLLKKGAQPFGSDLQGEFSVFTPYQFAIHNAAEKSLMLRLSDFKSEDLLRNLKEMFDVTKANIQNHPCVVASFSGGIDNIFKVPVTYRVFFAEDLKMFPISWELQNDNHQVLATYSVTDINSIDLGKNLKLYYPARARIDYFASDASNISPTPINSGMIISIDELKFNDLTPDDFVVDPTSVDNIWDIDKKVVIKVPH